MTLSGYSRSRKLFSGLYLTNGSPDREDVNSFIGNLSR